ncbi:MAG TPA: ATP-binding cassette domain-containing protein [Candidatus Margulisiibacteriota bacterium]|nr:ATP-binding cassette domain-containing protein [Candidatus Margulisiibacteriota bacterium]
MSDIIVKAQNLSKRFYLRKSKKTFLRALSSLIKGSRVKDELWVLKDISFEIKKGEKIAIVGKNGCGKTTLLRIVTGIYDKTAGELEVKENPVCLFKFSVGSCGDLTVIDNIYLFGAVYGLGRSFLKNKIDDILRMAEISHMAYSALKELSTGQQARFALSVFFQVKSDFLVFDESLVSVDQGFVEKCKVYFQNLNLSHKTVIMTSHDASFLKEQCRRALWIDQGRIRAFGEAKEVIAGYERSFRSP